MWKWWVLLRGLRNIVAKEVKEMVRDPRILVGMILAPLLILPLMGAAIRTSTEAVEESTKTLSIAVVDLDKGFLAQNLTDFLKAHPNVKVKMVDAPIDEIAPTIQASNLTAVVVIPENFSRNITGGERGELRIYAVFRKGDIAESIAFSMTQSLIQSFRQSIIYKTIQEKFPDNHETILDPINLSQGSIVKGKPVDADPLTLFTFAQSQFFTMPLALFMLIILAMQLASTSVASEKEEKTLETMMSLPISRFTLLMGKLVGSTLVAALGAIATILGVVYYMGSFTFGGPSQLPPVDLKAVGLSPSLLSYVLLGISLFVSLLSALALAVVVSVFAEDVRGAQSLLGFVYMPLLIPMFVLMFADIQTLPWGLRVLLLALPFTHPMLAVQATITGDYLTPLLGIGYVSVFTLVVLFVAARIFATEKILTAKIRLGRKKTRED